MVFICTTIPLNAVQKTPSVGEIAIDILSSEWPLSLKSIHYRIKRRYGTEVTSQAVFKSIKKLRKKGIIQKEGTLYHLKPQWIQELHSFSTKAKKAYGERQDFNDY